MTVCDMRTAVYRRMAIDKLKLLKKHISNVGQRFCQTFIDILRGHKPPSPSISAGPALIGQWKSRMETRQIKL